MCRCDNTTDKELEKLYDKIALLEEKMDILIEEMDYINRSTMSNSDDWE